MKGLITKDVFLVCILKTTLRRMYLLLTKVTWEYNLIIDFFF
jgi:hypothetical protein